MPDDQPALLDDPPHPLTVTERWRHGYDVFPDSNRTQPFGSGATCFYNYMDLMVRNDTPDTWRLVLQVTDTHLEGEWRADGPQTCRYEVYEKEHEIRGSTGAASPGTTPCSAGCWVWTARSWGKNSSRRTTPS